jgi:hypothetical protein
LVLGADAAAEHAGNVKVDRSDAVLRAAAWSWAVVVLIGQCLFVYFLLAHYGVATVSGHPERWNETELVIGYARGDTLGNIAFATHVLLAAVVLLGGTLQLVPQIRDRAIGFHRWNGRVFLLAALVVSIDGLYMLWVRHAILEIVNSLEVSLDAILVVAFVIAAWRAALARNVDRHRRWALRAFMVIQAVYFVRVFSSAWVVLTGGLGMTEGMKGPMNYFFGLGQYMLPLAVLELYLRAQASTRPSFRFAVALVVVLATVYIAIGTFAFLPHRLQMVT